MARTYKVLGQTNPVAGVLTTGYTVPASTQVVVSSIVISDRGGSAATFRVSVAVAGAADAVKQYLAYNTPIAANDVVPLVIGATLGPADVIRVYGSVETLAFSVFGEEIT